MGAGRPNLPGLPWVSGGSGGRSQQPPPWTEASPRSMDWTLSPCPGGPQTLQAPFTANVSSPLLEFSLTSGGAMSDGQSGEAPTASCPGHVPPSVRFPESPPCHVAGRGLGDVGRVTGVAVWLVLRSRSENHGGVWGLPAHAVVVGGGGPGWLQKQSVYTTAQETKSQLPSYARDPRWCDRALDGALIPSCWEPPIRPLPTRDFHAPKPSRHPSVLTLALARRPSALGTPEVLVDWCCFPVSC